jgi:hypothetical protein
MENFKIELESFSGEYGRWSQGTIKINEGVITTSSGEGDYTSEYLWKLKSLFGEGPYTREHLEDDRIEEYLSSYYEEDARTEGGVEITVTQR